MYLLPISLSLSFVNVDPISLRGFDISYSPYHAAGPNNIRSDKFSLPQCENHSLAFFLAKSGSKQTWFKLDQMFS